MICDELELSIDGFMAFFNPCSGTKGGKINASPQQF